MRFGKFYEGFLDSNQIEVWFEEEEVLWVAGDDGLSCTYGANDDVGVDDVGCSGFGEEEADSSGIGAVEFDKIRVWLTNQS